MSDFKRIPIKIDAATCKQINDYGSVVRDTEYFRLLFDETVILCCEFYDVDWSSGTAVLTPHPINPTLSLAAFGDNDFDAATAFMFLTEQSAVTPDTDGVNDIGDWHGDTTADPAQGQLSFKVNTNTDRFTEAVGSGGSYKKYYFVITGVPEGETAKTVLAYFQFKAENRPSSSAGMPATADPEYYDSQQIDALLKAGYELQFSIDSSTLWHDTQAAEDLYWRYRYPGGVWSDGIAMVIGPKGDAAPAMQIQYSADNADWHSVFAEGDYFIRFSVDAGNSWSSGVQFVGLDGVDSFNYVAYASDNTGIGWSLTPSDTLKYRAEIHSSTELTPVEADFSGAIWVKYLGNDGLDGDPGDNAPLTQIQYSADGSTDWHTTFAQATDKYIRISVDGGSTWADGMRIVGIDGEGLNPRGAYDSGTTYATNDAVTYNGSLYRSLQDSNTGNNPATASAYWELTVAAGKTPLFISGTFVDGDLTDGVLTISHTQGDVRLPGIITNSSGAVIIPDSITYASNQITVDLSSFGTLSGTWNYAFGGGVDGRLTADQTLTVGTSGKSSTFITRDGVAVDKGDGTVGIPVYHNYMSDGDSIKIEGTTNYDGTFTVETGSTTSEIIITATYVAETFPTSRSTAVIKYVQPQAEVDALLAFISSISGKDFNNYSAYIKIRDGYYNLAGSQITLSDITNITDLHFDKEATSAAYTDASINPWDTDLKPIALESSATTSTLLIDGCSVKFLLIGQGIELKNTSSGVHGNALGIYSSSINGSSLHSCRFTVTGSNNPQSCLRQTVSSGLITASYCTFSGGYYYVDGSSVALSYPFFIAPYPVYGISSANLIHTSAAPTGTTAAYRHNPGLVSLNGTLV
jgi:hypothetical protein